VCRAFNSLRRTKVLRTLFQERSPVAKIWRIATSWQQGGQEKHLILLQTVRAHELLSYSQDQGDKNIS